MTKDDDNSPDENDELLERLVSLQERTIEEMDEQRERLDELEDMLDEGRDTNPDGEGEKDADGTEGDDPEDDVDDRRLSVVLEEDADEAAQKEFEALKELASDDGEVELADSETKLFAEEEESTEDSDTDDPRSILRGD
jgi:hypothetical protein